MDIRSLDVGHYSCLFISLLCLSPILLFLFAQRKARLPPGPFAWPVVGNIFGHDWRKAHLVLTKLAESYGPLMSLRLGARLVVVASSPEAAREILKTHDRDLSGRYIPQIANIVPEVHTSVIAVATECNDNWRFLRGSTHTGLFSAKALESYSQIRLEKAMEMLDFLGSKDGEVVNIADILFATNANIIANAMVSQDIIVSWKNVGELKGSIRKVFDCLNPGIVDLYPAIGALDFWSERKAEVYKQITRAMWGDIVSRRRGGRRQDVAFSNRDFLDILIESSFNDNQIYYFLTELLGSCVSVSTVTEWAMAELIRNEEAFSKLREEIMTIDVEGTALSEKRLSSLPYLQAFIKETLRLHPPDPFLVPRCAVQTCSVMNYQVPKNSLLLVNAYAIGRDERTWEDPQIFKPERFLSTNFDVKGSHCELLPFGGGRRMCLGYPLALKLIQLLLASLVYGFDWFLPQGLDPAKLDMNKQFVGITLRREKPLSLIPKIRN
ncbi:probable (S)-N-methylcoclaurine 3'-hydroxylase isozyme 2 [Coffea eugenioides]|uniref:probable (S)-N-methylcoclaurine 3'-hydroxylase isozyme 2 n=1 Tax=Coffea eugenioides TaxID=49369 RepID=UPI000F5C3B1B|nr:probable (S)-N-methylcoclaurine 3'-hydroxylase isozyme 2 [Coffea arabica]XP_027169398.1 probable (S)-N-methylcoclaurine 3'-hydroxylase isozyme 2 [Coffea eugenioides]